MIVQDVPAEVRIDPAVTYEAAVADRRAGRDEEALDKLGALLRLDPEHVDGRVLRGLTLLNLGRLDAAESDFRIVLATAPDYVDARIGLARVAQRRGDLAQARAEAAAAALASPQNRELLALKRALAPAPEGRLDLDVSRSRLGADLPAWTEVRLGGARGLNARWTLGGTAEWTERFGDSDLYVEARLDRRFRWGGLYAAIGGAPSADYRPESAVRVGGEARLSANVAATLDASASRFPVGTVTGLAPGVTATFAEGRMSLASRWIAIRDERDQHRSGYAVTAQWAPTDWVRLRLDHADAPEASEGVTVDVSSLSLGAEIALNLQFSLRFNALHEDRSAYDRQALTIGVGWRFY